ncbi:MAG: hypothetical protein ACP6IU_13115 [Candidatus Asgardarchaeia archaeon]
MKLFKKKEETPAWAIAAQKVNQIKKLLEDTNDLVYLTAFQSAINKLKEFVDAKIKKLEKGQ